MSDTPQAGEMPKAFLAVDEARRDAWQRDVLDPLFEKWWRQTYGTEPPAREWRPISPT